MAPMANCIRSDDTQQAGCVSLTGGPGTFSLCFYKRCQSFLFVPLAHLAPAPSKKYLIPTALIMKERIHDIMRYYMFVILYVNYEYLWPTIYL